MQRLECVASRLAAHCRIGSPTYGCPRSSTHALPYRRRVLGVTGSLKTTATSDDGDGTPSSARAFRALRGPERYRPQTDARALRYFSSTALPPHTNEAEIKVAAEVPVQAAKSSKGSRSALDRRRKAAHEERRKLQRRKERDANQQQARAALVENLTYRSDRDFHLLFNRIAPRVPITKIRDALRKLKALQRQSERGAGVAAVAPASFVESAPTESTRDGAPTPDAATAAGESFADRLFDLHRKTPPDDLALKSILAFLLSESVDDAAAAAAGGGGSAPPAAAAGLTMAVGVATSPAGLAAHAPLASKQMYMIELLLEMRRRAWKESLAWDYSKRPASKLTVAVTEGRDENSGEHARLEAAQVVSRLLTHLPTKKRNSLLDLLESYTGMSETAYAAAPSAKTAGAPNPTTNQAQPTERASKTANSRLNILSLTSQLQNRLRSHYHLVATPIATFLGYDVEETVEKDVAYVTSHERWRLYRQEFTAALLAIQDGLFRDAFVQDPHRLLQQHHAHQMLRSHVTDSAEGVGDDDVHPSKPQPPVLVHRRVRRPVHAVMDALYIHETTNPIVPAPFDDESNRTPLQSDHTSTSDTDGTALHAPAETTVFLDNLPIDITSDEVTELYRRCGDISSVRIFNQRPGLDPGPLSQLQLTARRRGRALPSTRFRKWQRPRSPVYAVVAFESPTGYEACISDSLRIFGMLIQKHPVRSLRASDMTKLYLEGILSGTGTTGEAYEAFDDGIPSLDLEYQLREHLGPDLFVCLDARQYNRAMVGSCEIRFPSFETARECFAKLQDLPLVRDDPGCSVQWMRTPKDAVDWWTRKRGFD